jgi:restriction endonuclease S subunit
MLLKENKICEKVCFRTKIIIIQEYMQYIEYKVKIIAIDQLGLVAACSNLYGKVSSSNPVDNTFLYFYTIKIIIQTINAYKKTRSHKKKCV